MKTKVLRLGMAAGLVAMALATQPQPVAAEGPCERTCTASWAGCLGFAMLTYELRMIEWCNAWHDGCLIGCEF